MAFNKPDLIRQLELLGHPHAEVVLTFDEFFTGNEYEGSIGVNIYPDKPPVSKFREIFKKLMNDGLADAVFVRITDIEDPEEWVFSDGVYVIGKLSKEQLEESIKELQPTDIGKGWAHGKPVNIKEYDKTKNVFTIFWD